MTEPQADLGMRLYGMMQFLLSKFADQGEMHVPPARDVVSKQDALDAVVLLAAAVDEPAQRGDTPVEAAKHMASLLMVIRDYIEPLPPGEGPDGRDMATEDLAEMVSGIRTAKGDLLGS